MQKRLIFTVNVGNKMLCSLGQVQNGLEVDDLCTGSLYRGVLLGQQTQIMQFFRGERNLCFHVYPPYFDFNKRINLSQMKVKYRGILLAATEWQKANLLLQLCDEIAKIYR